MKIQKLLFKYFKKAIGRVFLAVFCAINFAFIITTNQAISLFDTKTDTIAQAVDNYHGYIKHVVENKFPVPDIRKMLKANVVIMCITDSSMGSGVVIKKNNELYILSVAHIGKRDGIFAILENGKPYLVEPVRMNRKIDLALFKFIEKPDSAEYVELSRRDPKIGDNVICVGNPADMEDAVTKGNIVQATKLHYFITAPLFMGSSGGGLYNSKGNLVGINCSIKLTAHGVTTLDPVFAVGRSIKLKVIKKFLGI